MRNDDFERLVNRFSSEWQAEARKAFARLFALLKGGKKLDVAVDMLQTEYPALFTLPGLQSTLVEAACYGYGIAPTVLTSAMYKDWEADLSKSWAADNMKLSKRLHTASIEMRNRIIDTVRAQMSRNSTWVETARALFDGYNADKVINEQALPKYITEVRRATRGSEQQLKAARKAINNIERLAKNGAPTKSLQTAYKNLLTAALTGSEKQLENACYVAVQEKSRYVAERIARTEMARAYSDGFYRSVADDEDVVAVRWYLNTGHPVFDICDMYMRADLFGLGAGIYPKDKTPPLPAHPFCLCRLSKVYVLDKKPADHIRAGGDKWLQGLSDVHQNMVLGIEGAKAWRNGEDWRKYMRSWQGVGKAGTRLQNRDVNGKLKAMTRRTKNAGEFSHLELPMQQKTIRQVAKKYNIDIAKLRFKIQRDANWLRAPYSGIADPSRVGNIDILPKAFLNESEMARTLIHEKSHVKQYIKYGTTYVQNNKPRMEDVSERFEDFWFKILRRNVNG